MNENCTNKNSSSRRVIKSSRGNSLQKLKSENLKSQINSIDKSLLEEEQQQQQSDNSLLNCDNKINHCNHYDVSNGLFSANSKYSSRKLSIDDESSHPINASNTNNKIERKRNINMLNDIHVNEDCSVGCIEAKDDVHDVIVGGGNTKRMKVDCDGQDNNKSKMYQVSIKKKEKKNERKRKKKKFSTLHLCSSSISLSHPHFGQ